MVPRSNIFSSPGPDQDQDQTKTRQDQDQTKTRQDQDQIKTRQDQDQDQIKTRQNLLTKLIYKNNFWNLPMQTLAVSSLVITKVPHIIRERSVGVGFHIFVLLFYV